ncbi:hypothetical protein I7I50_11368 [Histoplasma capsulatum G186AR]|uniref:Uncharacterized protein n=1 Tax=Ajellomyces capsulatus TaxID=5037 RepID=A0A8H8D851_AJECA|nr:hypothetical protein I7I52_02606 [Histoplasma capsulatum]QSS69920.1 hypothetical protein I7I50_11368 [Histoplasma capsulatum G186AR]
MCAVTSRIPSRSHSVIIPSWSRLESIKPAWITTPNKFPLTALRKMKPTCMSNIMIMEMFNSVMTVSEDTLFLKRQILRSEVKEMVPYSKTIIDYPGVVSWTKWT